MRCMWLIINNPQSICERQDVAAVALILCVWRYVRSIDRLFDVVYRTVRQNRFISESLTWKFLASVTFAAIAAAAVSTALLPEAQTLILKDKHANKRAGVLTVYEHKPYICCVLQ